MYLYINYIIYILYIIMNYSFNHKKKTRKSKISNNTLDYLHNQKIMSINNNKSKLKDYIKKKNDLTKKYDKLFKKKFLSENELNLKYEYLNEIDNLNKLILSIEKNEEEDTYLLSIGNILFEYYNNENDIITNNFLNNNDKNNNNNNNNNNNTNILLKYFNNNKTNISSKGKLLDEYLNVIDNTYESKKNKIIDDTICNKCNNKLNINYIEGVSICINCGEQYNILIDSDKPNYKEPTYESNYFAYKRINHFNEWLSQFQAKESTDISGDIIEKILIELQKERIFNVANISNNKIRDILKKLKLNKFYEHIPYIINKINGKPPPTITKQVEEKLRYMFKEIQTPFEKHCPKNRKNFLSYSYVIHKFIQLLNMNEYLVYFPLLKSREKLYQQDLIWKNICNDLDWKFINSI